MATGWVLNKISDALAPTVSGAVSGAGSFAGGAVNAVGNSINGVGEGINHSIRRYGDGAKDYGNAIMDWTRADAVRGATASNPLGLASGVTGGKRQVTSPQVYRPPASSPSKTLTTTSKTAAPHKKRIEGATPKKALPAPGGTKPGSAAPAKKNLGGAPKPVQSAAKTSPTTSNPGAMRRKPGGEATTNKKVTPVKPATSSAPKKGTTATTTRPKVQGNHTAAANPLGISM